jgi:hypothetical protein
MPIDATAEFAIAWRPDGIYFFLSVTDPTLVPAAATDDNWKGDGVELYVDSDGTFGAPPNYDDPGTRQIVIGVPAPTSRTSVWLKQGYLSEWTGGKFVSAVRPGGYVVEAFVTAQDLGLATWSLAKGDHVGIDLGINVSFRTATQTGSAGHRLGQYFLRASWAGNLFPYFNVNAFCTPTLGD